jgi:hypothetical protein
VEQGAEQRAQGGKMEKGELGPATRVPRSQWETDGRRQAMVVAVQTAPAHGLGGVV